MANNFLTIDFQVVNDADSRRANAGDVKKFNKRDDQTISQQARSPSLHSYLFYSVNSPSLMAVNYLTIAIDGLVDADLQKTKAGDVKKINKCDDQTISHQARSLSLHTYLFY